MLAQVLDIMDKDHDDDPKSTPAGRSPPMTPVKEVNCPDSACGERQISPLGPVAEDRAGRLANGKSERSRRSCSDTRMNSEEQAADDHAVARSSRSETVPQRYGDVPKQDEAYSSDLNAAV